MKGIYQIATLLLLQLILVEVVFAYEQQVNNLEIKQIDGLPQNEVNAIYEDKRGFIWIGTLDGLFRYDGYNYRAYQIDDTKKSLKSNMILAIDEDSAGNIWLGTYGQGISKLNPQTGAVSNYSLQDYVPNNIKINDIVTIVVDCDDNIWLGNWYGILKIKLNRHNYEPKKCTYYPISEHDLLNRNYINVIHEDKSGNIWVGSNSCVRRITGEEDGHFTFEQFDVKCYDICDYDNSSIITAGSEITLFKKGEYDDKFRYNLLKPLHDSDAKYANQVVVVDKSNIWFGGRDGISHLMQEEGGEWDIKQNITKDDIPFSIPTNVVSSMIITDDRQIWVGTRSGGIFTIKKRIKPFTNYPQAPLTNVLPNNIIKAIYEDSNGGIWVGTEENGLYYQAKGAKEDDVKNIVVNESDNRAYAFEQSGNKSTREVMWVGTTYPNNLVAIDINTLQSIPQKVNTNQFGFIFTLKMSDENTLWAGTYNSGLWRCKIDNYGHIIESKHFKISNSTLSSNIIRSLYIAESGDLYIGTDVGVNRVSKEDINSDQPQFKRNLKDGSSHTLNDHYTLQIINVHSGKILFGTMGRGLIIYDPDSDSITSLTTKDGLANNSIKSIVEDTKTNNIWLSTNRGLSKYNPSMSSITNYDNYDGLMDCEFSEICGIRRSDGTIVFGNRIGFVSFDPSRIIASYVTPNLFFTDLYINHKLVEIGEDPTTERTILSRGLDYTSYIELEYDERNFSIGFVGVNFSSQLGNKYRVMLDGIDKEWRNMYGSELLAQYTNIPDGNYTFRVRAANSDGIWSDNELRLKIKVKPPMSRTTIAYIIYLILILIAIYLIYWIVSSVSMRRRQMLITQMELERSEEMVQYKLEFFMNISHEFRTPLTLINIPLEKMLSKINQIKDQEMVEELSEIKFNVDVLLSLVNQLLDFRKIERGKEAINPTCVNIVEYLTTYFNYFKRLSQKQNINYNYLPGGDVIKAEIDRRLFEKVIVNMLSNAFKYTPVCGCIDLYVTCDNINHKVIITLKDNGRGVASEDIPFLFDQFYQANNSRSSAYGSGIGLALSRSIVELHNGEMRIESELNRGFTAIVELPLAYGEIDSSSINLQPPLEANILANEVGSSKNEEPLTLGVDRHLILIVEDNVHMRKQLSKELFDEFDIVCAENGEVGFEICRKELPSLVITDIMMPVMDGIEMCRLIKEDEMISHTPIMVLTADSTIKSQIDSFTIGGADGYLNKPFNIEVLKSKIKTILRNRDIMKSRFQKQSIVNPEDIASSPADLKYISKVIEIIKNNMSNPELNIEFIAKEYGVSRTYLNRKIKALTGETSTQFLRNIRLKYAAKLLQQKSMNVTEVAWAVGYNDISTFRIRFKEMFGVSPTNYKGEDAIISTASDIDL